MGSWRRAITRWAWLTAIPVAAATAVMASMSAAATTGDVNCATLAPQGSTTFIGKVTVAHDLIVPTGTGCGPTEGSKIGHDVIIEKGGSFFPGGTTIGNDVRADHALEVELGDPNNGTTPTKVGGDVIVNGQEGPNPYGNFICDTHITGDLLIEDSSSKASGFDVGYPDPYNCGRNSPPNVSVGGNATFMHNWNNLEVGSLKDGHTLTFTYDRAANNILYSTVSGHRCYQAHNSKSLTGWANRVRNGKNNCNIAPPRR